MRYYVQHGAGLGRLVAGALGGDLDEVRIVFSDDSSAVFDTGSDNRRVASLPYLKNSFQVLGSVPRGSLAGSVDQLVKMTKKRGLLRDQRRGSAFRTMVNVDGQLMPLPRETRTRLESVIAEQTGGRFNPRGGSGVEYWVIGRRDLDSLLFGVRLTAGPKKTANRGSLSSDLSTLLVKASEPRSDDVFLDPFGGSGSIVVARLESPFRKAIWSDIRLPELRSELPARLVNSRKVHVLGEDALRLPSVPDGSISSIITDPPWGEYEDLGRPYGDFIAGVMASFDRVLDPVYGRLVILLSRRASSAVAEVWRQADFRIEHSHDILVNGHPATVLVGGR